jgi:hypothetical protein
MWLKKGRTMKPNQYTVDAETGQQFALYVAIAVFAYIVISIVLIFVTAE